MDVPNFIFECLEQELLQVQLNVLKRVSKLYDIPLEELQREVLPPPVKITPEEKVYICKKQRTKKLPNAEERCNARIWNRGTGGQCTRCKCAGTDFCKQHLNKQRHGLISDTPPKGVFCKTSIVLYK